MDPLLSIVIANYNYGRFLDEAIQSVLSQVGEGRDQVLPGEVELIIIDGGSTDNSVEVIRKYAGELPSGVQRGDPSIVDLHLPPTPSKYVRMGVRILVCSFPPVAEGLAPPPPEL